MLISRLCRVGFRVARELSRGGCTHTYRTRYYTQGPCRQYQQSLLEFLPEIRAFHGAVLQKYHGISTSASDGASAGGDEEKEEISVTFVSKDGEDIPIRVPIGISMLEAAHENDIELEGACEGSLACSTCHVIVMDMEYYNKLEDPVDEENDMLDLAFGLTETSRLGCQIVASSELDGIRLAIPAATRNFAVDGYVAKPH
ncbi:2Fe-2S ferredoxin [Hibiscus syriacus]|uniref:2Fe-2S ferredoxin n=1 Tax=Hibiscus syriacus TaxID=106335 RepID=A0A6A2WGS0_HIBSY|nr:2Fe-2S ferredoxin-like [Hibiscus syriacus]KAE8658013.1 2Fe-2S ferredoxin [Hibiscus syriacus]